MNPLEKKLALVLVLKLAVLFGLWWDFLREQRVPLDAQRVAAQLPQPPANPVNETKP